MSSTADAIHGTELPGGFRERGTPTVKRALTPQLIADTIDRALVLHLGGLDMDAAFDQAYRELGNPTVLDYALGNVEAVSEKGEPEA